MKLIRIYYLIIFAFTFFQFGAVFAAEPELNKVKIEQLIESIEKDQSTPPQESVRKIDSIIEILKDKDLSSTFLKAIAVKVKILTLAEQHNEAIILIKQYISEAERLKLNDIITAFELSSLRISGILNDSKKVLEIRRKLLDKTNGESNSSESALIFMGVAYSFYLEKNYARALQYFKKAYDIYLALNQLDEIALVLNDLGNIYLDLEEYDKAKKYFKETLTIYQANQNAFMESITLYNLGKAYLLNKEYKNAEELFKELIKLSTQLEDEIGVQWAKSSLADVYFENEQWQEALELYIECNKAFEQYNHKRMHFNCLSGVVETNIELRNIKEAENILSTLQELANNMDDKFIEIRYLKVSAKLAFAKNDYLNAYKAEKQYSNQKELIFKNEQKQNTQKYRIQFETELQENENKILLRENQLKNLEIEKQLQQKKYSNMILILAGLIILIFSFMLYKQTQHRNRFKAMALQDHLTSSPNRRAILEYAKEQFEAAKKYETELSIGIVDLDFFKKINDTYGHDVGDEVLKSFANACKTVLRQEDKFGRYGGEEWLFVLPNASKDNIAQIFQRLRNEINSKPIKGFPEDKNITFSMGVAELNGETDDNLHALILRADECLYTAKDMGRDQLEMENI